MAKVWNVRSMRSASTKFLLVESRTEGALISYLDLKFDSSCSGLRTNIRFKKVTSKSMFLLR